MRGEKGETKDNYN